MTAAAGLSHQPTHPEPARHLRPIVVSGPSGTGKSTILQRLFAEYPDKFGFSISHTTRAPREGEKDGCQYHFTDKPSFQKMVDEGGFIEHAQFSGNCYGTSFKAVRDVAKLNRICILDIEMEGVKQMKRTSMDARFVFLEPPSMEVLRERLCGRGTETEESIERRMDQAKREIAFAKESKVHDKIIVNNDLNKAYEAFKEWVFEEKRDQEQEQEQELAQA